MDLIFLIRNFLSESSSPSVQARHGTDRIQAQNRMEYPANVGGSNSPRNRQIHPDTAMTDSAGLITLIKYCLIGKSTYRLIIFSIAAVYMILTTNRTWNTLNGEYPAFRKI